MKSTVLRFIYIVFLLFILGISLTFIYSFTTDPGLGITSDANDSYKLTNVFLNLHRDIVGEIHTTNNYFGIIDIRFQKNENYSGSILFRIREKGKTKWYYLAKFRALDFRNSDPYSFGFSPIANSQNKTYEFQFIRLSGSVPIRIIKENKSLIPKYLFTIDALRNTPYKIPLFVINKAKQYESSHSFFNHFFVFLVPLYMYFLWAVFNKLIKKSVFFIELQKLNHPLVLIFYFLTMISSVSSTSLTDLAVLQYMLFWLICVVTFSLSERESFFSALLFLIVTPVLMIGEFDQIAQNTAVWAYMFMVFGTIHAFIKQRSIFSENILTTSIFSIPLAIIKLSGDILNTIPKILLISSQRVLDYVIIQAPKTSRQLIIMIVRTSLATLIFLVIFSIGYLTVRGISRYNQRLSYNPIVYKIEPKIAYHATKVIIRGKPFGWNPVEPGHVLVNNKPVAIDLWTSDKIIFTVPLDWKPGILKLQVVRNIGWMGKKEKAYGNTVMLKLLPIGSTITKEDDEYFKEIQNISKEARELNGYYDEIK